MGIGAYQDDSMQRLTGQIGRIMSNKSVGVAVTGVFTAQQAGAQTLYPMTGENVATWNVYLDSSNMARTSSETRGKATRFALRLAAC